MRAVDELAQVDLLENFIGVFQPQLLEVEQVAATGNGVVNVDDLAPLAIRAKRALAQLGLTGERLAGELVFTTAEVIAGPERVGLVAGRAGR